MSWVGWCSWSSVLAGESSAVWQSFGWLWRRGYWTEVGSAELHAVKKKEKKKITQLNTISGSVDESMMCCHDSALGRTLNWVSGSGLGFRSRCTASPLFAQLLLQSADYLLPMAPVVRHPLRSAAPLRLHLGHDGSELLGLQTTLALRRSRESRECDESCYSLNFMTSV